MHPIKPLHPERTPSSRYIQSALNQATTSTVHPIQNEYKYIISGFRGSGMWCGAGGWAVPDVLEDCIAFIFKHEANQDDSWHWTMKHYNPLKHKEPRTQLHNITYSLHGAESFLSS